MTGQKTPHDIEAELHRPPWGAEGAYELVGADIDSGYMISLVYLIAGVELY